MWISTPRRPWRRWVRTKPKIVPVPSARPFPIAAPSCHVRQSAESSTLSDGTCIPLTVISWRGSITPAERDGQLTSYLSCTRQASVLASRAPLSETTHASDGGVHSHREPSGRRSKENLKARVPRVASVARSLVRIHCHRISCILSPSYLPTPAISSYLPSHVVAVLTKNRRAQIPALLAPRKIAPRFHPTRCEGTICGRSKLSPISRTKYSATFS